MEHYRGFRLERRLAHDQRGRQSVVWYIFKNDRLVDTALKRSTARLRVNMIQRREEKVAAS
jgi:hypothetical protein